MPKPYQRTRSRKRNVLKLPGKGASVHYKSERIGASHCAKCGRVLPGIPTLVRSRMRSLPGNQRRLQRMYGGQLCHACLQEALKRAIRSSSAS